MATHRRAPRPYRGGKRRTIPVDLTVSEVRAEPLFAPGEVVDLAFNPAEPRDAQGQWTISPTHIVDKWLQATEGERTAGKDWYPAAHRTAVALSKKYGVSVKEAAGLLATYSPQTPWGRNQVLAAETLREGHGLGGPGAVMYFQHDNPALEDRVGLMATGGTRALAEKVLHGADFDATTAGVNKDGSLKPGAPKIRAFYHLIAAGGQDDPNDPRVVIDRHAMSVAFGRRVTEDDYTRMRPGSRKKYAPFLDAYVKAAAEISRTEGRTVSPEEVQATTWLVQQRENADMNNRVGKTRDALGKKDWAEWLQYASTYLGLDSKTSAQTGYTELAKQARNIIDLAHDVSHELRDADGKWTDTPSLKKLLPIASLLTAKREAGKHKPAKPPIIGKPVYARVVTEEKHPLVRDRNDMYGPYPGPAPDEALSVRTQRDAQVKSETWARGVPTYDGGEDAPEDTGARLLWNAYQNPSNYGEINKALRGSKQAIVMDDGEERQAVTADELREYASQMFREGGVTTTSPMTVFRALRNTKDRDWAKTLAVGSTFEEQGIVSSTAYRRLAQGWLGLSGKANGEAEDMTKIDSDDVVLEIKVPVGSRVVGGVVQFIETMLPPGTKFKIVQANRVRTPNAVNPLGNVPVGADVVYTHVVAEAILPPEFMAPPKHRTDLKARAKAVHRAAIERSPYAVSEED